jgi:hypothetical protein
LTRRSAIVRLKSGRSRLELRKQLETFLPNGQKQRMSAGICEAVVQPAGIMMRPLRSSTIDQGAFASSVSRFNQMCWKVESPQETMP